ANQFIDPKQYEAESIHYYFFSIGSGALGVSTYAPLNDEEIKLFKLFRNVFELAYRRYADIEKAEAQAREAKIEAALERVRAKAMAMHKSDDLNAAVAIVFEELDKLNLGMLRCGIGILSKEKRCADVWTTTVGDQGRVVQVSGDESLDIHPLLQGAYRAWVNQGEFSYMLDGDDMSDYYTAVSKTNFHLPKSQSLIEHEKGLRQYYYACAFQSGNLFAFRETDFSEEAKTVMKRFAGVFNLTYTRFNDLKQAELQTHKARIEVALERVRARALAMQQPEELVEVAEVMRHEMGLLGVEELETSSIYIHDSSSDIAECWFALRDPKHPGKKLISDHITMDLQQTRVGREMLEFYNSDDITITIPMTGESRKEWVKYCYTLSKPFDKFYGEDIPDRTYHLYKFSNGAIGAAAPGNISEESWDLLKRTAAVFSLAYSRFKDLTKARFDLHQLKEEKKRAEDALANLKITQAQLIQSEKMASLGELTAGIAHEIKNPLNFVNNFSELSNALLDEFVNTTNESERKELAEDLKQNLSIINEHGKRADSIVKNMLEHSRTGTGKKQLTNINQLCEEFFNLAYHGIRANNPDFNCEMKKQLAPDLPGVNIVSQDISRVLLNLFNNAFYAVNEKSRQLAAGSEQSAAVNKKTDNYKPIVELITRSSNRQITISVKDNGNGIPNPIKEKIFEPFFTTKPAGKGTGLGLSLSYDIITKGHGGALKVETKEGEGSTFIIQLSAD
ncbi:MAG TPA: ATP-binding protein, partial [Bacteroidia bacterium]|nr:ATP-binding protein [Bacteroidia bacterium]